ncbi:SAM-dependent methyltransferase [Halobacteriales archaeon QS_1_67_19]|nr:MAG: SAM-dependent methyltransferase [Halobacteriales archaeon QS_1_67_19]
MADPFGRAVRDHHRGQREEPLLQRDGERTREHPIDRFYFSEFAAESDAGAWLESHLDGPLLDMGAGAGRHAHYFQERFETVAIEVSELLVETMRERGVEDAREASMFELREHFERDRFRSALAIGTQVGLAGSTQGLREFLGDLAHVTTPDATAVLDCYDPALAADVDMLGYRSDPAPGLAHRVMWFEYDGDAGDALVFRLFSPDRVREATVGTGWAVADVEYGPEEDEPHYRIALRKD